MTDQIADIVLYDSRDFELAEKRGKGLFEPKDFGISIDWYATNCRRGYQCVYACDEGTLILEEMGVFASTVPPPIGGVAPVEGWFFSHEYNGLRLGCPFTGALMLVADLVSKVYRGVTPQPPAYRDVRELRFEEGRLVGTCDHSALMSETREQLRALRSARPMEEWGEDDWNRFFAMMWPFAPAFEAQPPA